MTQMFAVSAMDKPGALDLRLATRPDHLAYWEENAGSMVLAGPYLDDEGKAKGSLMVVKAQTLEEARALVDNDPYAKAGLFESVSVTPWNWVIKRPEGI